MKTVLLLLALLLIGPSSHADELVFAVSTGSAMPMTDFRNGALAAGLLKDFGDALARELHKTPRYLPVPRKRVEAPLASGQADLLCDLRPEWLEGKDWRWTEAIFNNRQIVVSRRDTPAVKKIADLHELRTGTILGYRYAEIEQALGAHFVRDDALSDDANLAKLLRNRFSYMLTNSLYYDYQRKTNPGREHLNPQVFQIMNFDTYCALPPHGKLDPASVDKAIQTLKKRGDIQSMLDQFRPARSRD